MPRNNNGRNRSRNGANNNTNNNRAAKSWCHSHSWGNHTSKDCNRRKPDHDENATPPAKDNNNNNNRNQNRGDDRNSICTYCDEVGHKTGQCPSNPQNPDPGAILFETNNRPGAEANETHPFGQSGFRGIVRDTEPRWQANGLRNDETSEAAKKIYCCFCNTTDHEEFQCRNLAGKIKYHDSKLGCAGCHVRGHMKDECKNPVAQRCMRCQRKGHTTTECRIAKTTAMEQFISAISAPPAMSRFKWQNVDNIIPNRIQALRLWLDNEKRQAQLDSRFISHEEMSTVEQLIHELENSEGQRAQRSTDQASALNQLQADLMELMAEVQNRTEMFNLRLNYDVSGDMPTFPIGSHTDIPPHILCTNPAPGLYSLQSSTGGYPKPIVNPYSHATTSYPSLGNNLRSQFNFQGTQQQARIIEEAMERIRWEKRRSVDNAIQSKINKSKRYGHSHINYSLLRLEKEIMEKQLLSRSRMDEIKYAMSRRVQFFRDPEAVKALFERKRPCCMKCGGKGYILDRHFAEVKDTTTVQEIMSLEDFDDWGVVVAFECECCVTRNSGQPVGYYCYNDLPQYIKSQIRDEFW